MPIVQTSTTFFRFHYQDPYSIFLKHIMSFSDNFVNLIVKNHIYLREKIFLNILHLLCIKGD